MDINRCKPGRCLVDNEHYIKTIMLVQYVKKHHKDIFDEFLESIKEDRQTVDIRELFERD